MDLRDDPNAYDRSPDSPVQFIRREQGQKLANKIRAVRYLECSSLTQKGLKNVFEEAVRALLFPKEYRPRRTSCQIV